MSRVSRYLVGRFAAAWLAVAMVTAGVVLAALEALGDVRVVPSPWVAVGPTAVVAAAVALARTRARGEDVAFAAGSASPWQLAWPTAIVVIAVLTIAGGPSGIVSFRGLEAGAVAAVGIDGELLVVDAEDRAVLWRAGRDRPDPPRPRASLAAFTPRPRTGVGLAARLFVAHPPWRPTDLTADPTRLRWLWAALSVALPAVILARAALPHR